MSPYEPPTQKPENLSGDSPVNPKKNPSEKKSEKSDFPYRRVLLKISGSVAAYKACSLISLIKQKSPATEIQVVATHSAPRFVGLATLQALSGRPVAQDLYGGADAMDHIHWARWADCALLYPASAHTLSSLAQGHGGNLLTSLFLAWELEKKPYFVAPAMNTKMWVHPATQKNKKTLEEFGVTFLPSPGGRLACGEFGAGRLLDPEPTFEFLCHTALSPSSSQKNQSRVLITSGGSLEAIDGVRSLTNFSTGQTGCDIAQFFLRIGRSVDLVHGQRAITPKDHKLLEKHPFASTDDLEKKVLELIDTRSYQYVFHLAALSDFRIQSASSGDTALNLNDQKKLKIDSSKPLTLSFLPREKTINKMMKRISQSAQRPVVVAFKLTRTDSESERTRAVAKLFEQVGPDFVVHNDLGDREAGRLDLSLITKPTSNKMTTNELTTKMTTEITAEITNRTTTEAINKLINKKISAPEATEPHPLQWESFGPSMESVVQRIISLTQPHPKNESHLEALL